MPVYVYRCKNCEYEFEKIQKFSDDPIKVCPECSEEQVRKVITPAGIIFKGSGWYINDSKSNKKKDSGGSGSKKTDTKVNDATKDTSLSKAEGNTSSAKSDAKSSGESAKAAPSKSTKSAPKSD